MSGQIYPVPAHGAGSANRAVPLNRQPSAGPTPSHVTGRTDAPFPDHTIHSALAVTATNWPDHDALIAQMQSVRLTWYELDEAVWRFAAALIEIGLRPGDRVGLWAMNSAEWVIVQLATARAGLILVTINPAYRIGELLHVLRATECGTIVVGPDYRSSTYAAMLAEGLDHLAADAAATGAVASPPAVICFGQMAPAGWLGWDDVMASGSRCIGSTTGRGKIAARAAALDPSDPVNIQFTSGTTGLPKGVTLSHRNIVANGWFTGLAMGVSAADRLCLPVPLYHCFGMVTGVLLCVTHGTALVLPAPGFDPAQTLKAIAAERCTALYGVPTMFAALMNHPDFNSAALISLRTGIMAGAVCPVDLMQAAIDRMHMRDIAICYGMTEAPVSFQTSLDDPLSRRLDSVGRIQPHIEARLIDEHGQVVPVGTPGQICVRGYNTMVGYWRQPAATAAMKDAAGWVHTGDLGVLDKQGYLRIVGRLTDMVIRGGENLYPSEIEEFLRGHPAVLDVQVFGVRDVLFGEELCAWIVARDGAPCDEAAIRAFCAGQIAHHKVPRHVRFVGEFPMTVTGKVQKRALRDLMEQELFGTPNGPIRN